MIRPGIVRRALIAVCLLWAIGSIFLLTSNLFSETHGLPYDCFGLRNGAICSCDNENIILLTRWIGLNLPSVLIISILWATQKSTSTKILSINNKHLRFSISWLILCCTFLLWLEIFSYARYMCGIENKYYVNHFDPLIQFLLLLIPLYVYWIIRWIIKGKDTFL